MRPGPFALLLWAALAAPAWAQAPICKPDPLAGRALYLRGSFNAWGAADAQRFTWACNRWELVTRLDGQHRFKIGDEAWSADADLGSTDSRQLVARGPDMQRRFAGTERFTIAMADDKPELRVDSCPADGAAPLGATQLFMRGTPNNWAALDEFVFQYSCDAYYLNVKLQGRHEFKIADAAWKDASSFGSNGARLLAGGGNIVYSFSGEHTLRLAWAGNRPQLDIGPKSFADPRAVAVTDPVALSLRFDSRSSAHKKPFGAVPAGTTLDFMLTSASGVARVTLVVEKRRLEGNQEVLDYLPLARLPMTRSRQGGTDTWVARRTFGDVAVYGYWFEVEIAGHLYAFQNNNEPLYWTREKGTGGVGTVGELPANTGPVRRFRQTVYDPALRVPDWAADIVYYCIFPERFRNGDKSNDPQPGKARYHAGTVEKHARWMDKPWVPGSGDGSDDQYNNDFFGGDLAGIIDKLDYIRDLGANTIYMTPVFRAASNHKYDTADYKSIDPGFGSNADFERLTREAAKRGIRVIADASLNHTGADSIYFDRYGNFGGQGAFAGGLIKADSPYAGWYSFNPAAANPDQQYKGWVGVTDLPELNKASPAWRDFAFRKPDSVTQFWLDKGASGWRMDVAPWVPDDFWREWHSHLKAHKPDALTVAETWFDASKYFLGDMFDSTMNYIFRNTVQDFAAGGNAAVLVRQLEHLREAYPAATQQALMNLLSSHDQARALHVFGWHDDTRDPVLIERAKQRLRLAVLFQMTYPGAPAVYYGDEVGLTGGDDPMNRRPYPWADEGGQPDSALLADFKRLIHMRQDNPVLRRGSTGAPLLADEHVLVWVRRLGDRWAVTALNNASTPHWVTIALPAGLPPGELQDLLGGAPVQATPEGLSFEVPPLFGRVLGSP